MVHYKDLLRMPRGTDSHEAPERSEVRLYACPEYDKKYHGEKGCPNRVSTEIVEQILDILGEKIEEAEQKGEEINLTNYRFTHKMVECVVLSHSPFSLKISLKNKRAFLH